MTSLEQLKRMIAEAPILETLAEQVRVRAGQWRVECNPRSDSRLIPPDVLEAINVCLKRYHWEVLSELIEQVERIQKVADAAGVVCDDAVADDVHPESFCEVGTPELEALRQALEELDK